MKQKEIIHFITNLKTGGAQKMLLRVLSNNTSNNFNHIVCCFRSLEVGDDMTKDFEKNNITVHHLNVNNLYNISVISKFKQFLKKQHPDAIILYLTHTDIFGRIFGRIFGIKTIISSIRINTLKLNKIFFILDGLTSPLVSHFHFNSKITQQIYQKYFFIPTNKTTYIPNGTLDIYTNTKNIDCSQMRSKLDISQDTVVFGVVARLDKQKNHKLLIEAFSEASHKHKNIHLLLIGDGDQKEQLQKQIDDLEITSKATLLGNRTDVPELLKIIDIIIAPSLYEGMSNSLLEAMAAKKAIIASNIPENTCVVEDEKTALIFDKESISNLTTKIQSLLSDIDLRRSLADNAYAEFEKNYKIDIIKKQYEDFWKHYV